MLPSVRTLPVPYRSVEERLDTVEAKLDVITAGIEALLSEVHAIRTRWEAQS